MEYREDIVMPIYADRYRNRETLRQMALTKSNTPSVEKVNVPPPSEGLTTEAVRVSDQRAKKTNAAKEYFLDVNGRG